MIEDLDVNEIPRDLSENGKTRRCSTKPRRHEHRRCRREVGTGMVKEEPLRRDAAVCWEEELHEVVLLPS